MDGYNSINEHTTGYSNFKECFSQEDILEAFKSIDLNKDGQIDASDIRLFLDYMEESYSQDEVSEMIAMLNETDCHTVGYDEFRRLASGEIIGLTTYPTGDKERLKIQSRILSNMENTRLKHTLLPTNS
jgi:Ca2+-binding EF-hand superfamily protein